MIHENRNFVHESRLMIVKFENSLEKKNYHENSKFPTKTPKFNIYIEKFNIKPRFSRVTLKVIHENYHFVHEIRLMIR